MNMIVQPLKKASKPLSLLFIPFFISLTFLGLSAHGQTDDLKRNPYILTKNSFRIGLTEGFNTSKFTPIIGTTPPTSAVGIIPKLNFDYTFSLGDHFSFGLGIGSGLFPFMAHFDEKPPFESSKYWGPFAVVDYNVFADFRSMLSYHHWLSPKYGLNYTLGGGVFKPAQLKSSIGFGDEFEKTASFLTSYSGKYNPYFLIGLGVDKVLKNDDLLSFGIHYEFHTNELFSGQYRLYNNTDLGTYSNKGNSVNLSLYYTFTRARKLLVSENYTYEENIEFIDAKKKFNREKRYIDPKSMFFGFSSGIFSSHNQVTGNKVDLKSVGIPSWIVQLDAEIGWKNNSFIQYAFALVEHFEGYHVNYSTDQWFSASNAFISPMISGGFGYRLIGKNNINFLNVSAGFSLGANFNKKGLSGIGEESSISSNGTINYTLSQTSYTRRHLIPTLYLNLSRDFQLTKSLYLTADYRLNLGLITAHEQEIVLYVQPDLTIPHQNTIAIKGTSNAFQIGLKYKLTRKN